MKFKFWGSAYTVTFLHGEQEDKRQSKHWEYAGQKQDAVSEPKECTDKVDGFIYIIAVIFIDFMCHYILNYKSAKLTE